MKNAAEQLEKIAREIQLKDTELAQEVREAGQITQQGLDRILGAIHKLHRYISLMPDKLNAIADQIKSEP